MASTSSNTIQPHQRAALILSAYTELGNRVHTTLRTQIGDHALIAAQERAARDFLTLTAQVRHSSHLQYILTNITIES